MKKTFIVEVEYEELQENLERKADVFYDTALEVQVENLMEGYVSTNSIGKNFKVEVKSIKDKQQILEKIEELQKKEKEWQEEWDTSRYVRESLSYDLHSVKREIETLKWVLSAIE